MAVEQDYVLGTHDAEIERLRIQHNVWRARAFDAWIEGGFSSGKTLLDVGCGPGYAALDLAELVGSTGRVVAMDRSERFLNRLRAHAEARGLSNIESFQVDLEIDDLPGVSADGAWIRWVFAFLRQPRRLLEKIARRLKSGGTIVIHEYFDYATWRLAPRSEIFETFVSKVMESWRAEGGEPDVALDLPNWLESAGFVVTRTTPIVDVIRRDSFRWQWPSTFINVGLARLVDLGHMTETEASQVRDEIRLREEDDEAFMIAPSVLEIIAQRV